MSEMVHSYLDGDTAKSLRIQLQLVPLINALFSDVNPIPAKEALNILGWNVGQCRMPLCEMSKDGHDKLASVMSSYDLPEYDKHQK
jgi:4-hydroxy-tetrahydrodipicolinate synthase